MAGSELADRKCVPCHGGTPTVPEDEAKRLLAELDGWTIEDGKLARTFKFKDFLSAIDFVNRITPIAEEEGHHPDLEVGWGRVTVLQLLAGTGNVYGTFYRVVTSPQSVNFANGPPTANPYLSFLQLPISIAIAPFQYGTVTLAVISVILGTPATVWSVARDVLRRYWALLALYLLYTAAGIALVCLPLVIWLLVPLSMALPVLFTERASI